MDGKNILRAPAAISWNCNTRTTNLDHKIELEPAFYPTFPFLRQTSSHT